MVTFTSLTPQKLRRAANVKERIDALQNELSRLLGTLAPAASATGPAPRRKKISAAGIARIRAAQRARWAAIKKAKGPARPAPQAQDLRGRPRQTGSFSPGSLGQSQSGGQEVPLSGPFPFGEAQHPVRGAVRLWLIHSVGVAPVRALRPLSADTRLQA